jgi:hypothetical protein
VALEKREGWGVFEKEGVVGGNHALAESGEVEIDRALNPEIKVVLFVDGHRRSGIMVSC